MAWRWFSMARLIDAYAPLQLGQTVLQYETETDRVIDEPILQYSVRTRNKSLPRMLIKSTASVIVINFSKPQFRIYSQTRL